MTTDNDRPAVTLQPGAAVLARMTPGKMELLARHLPGPLRRPWREAWEQAVRVSHVSQWDIRYWEAGS